VSVYKVEVFLIKSTKNQNTNKSQYKAILVTRLPKVTLVRRAGYIIDV